MPGRIDGPYALDVAGSSDHSPTRCSPTAHLHVTQTVVESDRINQTVNKHLHAESAAYFGLKKVAMA